MQKGSAQILALVIAVLLIVVGAYLYSTRNSSTLQDANPIIKVISTSQTYTSSQSGFEFVYSKDQTTKEDTEELFNKRGNGDFRKNFKGYVTYEPGKFLGAAVVLGKDNSYESNPFTLWIFYNPEDLSIDNWYKNYWYYPFVWGDYTYTGKFELAPKQEATVAGQMAKSGVIDYSPGKPKFVYLTKDKKMFLFRVIGEDGNKILGTFKFL